MDIKKRGIIKINKQRVEMVKQTSGEQEYSVKKYVWKVYVWAGNEQI